jgi:hypothetical protein
MIEQKSESTVVDFLTCSNCGGKTHKLVPGKGPHAGGTICIDCGKFLWRTIKVWDTILIKLERSR